MQWLTVGVPNDVEYGEFVRARIDVVEQVVNQPQGMFDVIRLFAIDQNT
jgi:hypothetical protein